MSHQPKMPTDEELTELSRAELSKHLKSILHQLVEDAKQDKNTSENTEIYLAYQKEYLKRLGIAKKGNP